MLKKLIESMKKAMADSETMVKKLEEMPEDDENRSTLEEAIEAKSAEIDELQAKIETAQAKAKKDKALAALLAEAEESAKVEPKGKTLPESRTPAEPKDKKSMEAAHRDCFLDYCCGRRLDKFSGEQAKLLVLDDSQDTFVDGADGVRVPASMRKQLLGNMPLFNKALPAVSTSDSQGGYTVPEDFRAELIETPMPVASIFQRITVVPNSTGEVTWPKLTQTDSNEFGGVSVTWTAEGDERTDTEAIFGQQKISTNELSAYTEVSRTLLRRSALNLEALLGRLFRSALMYTLDSVILNGTGTTRPTGILNSGTSGVRTVTRTTASNVKFADLVSMVGQIKPYHRANGVWVMSPEAETNLMGQKDSQNRPLFLPNAGTGRYDSLIGYPVVVHDEMPAVADAGCVLFGDLSEYIGVMEEEIVLRRSDDYKFKTGVAAFTVHLAFGGIAPNGRCFVKLANAGS